MKKTNNDNTEINDILKNVETKFGKGNLIKLESEESFKIKTFSSGLKSLDLILGNGGFPKGRIIEIFGPESSGKTTLTLQAAAMIQQNDGVVAFIDAEHALDIEHARKMGVDPKKLIVSQPDSGEQALELVDYLCQLGKVDLIIIDSVASLIPQAEIDGSIGYQNIGLQARMMSKAMRVISASASKTNTTVIFINQLREKIGVMFGNPETTPGGRSLKFYSSIRLDVRIKERIRKDGETSGQVMKLKVVKNKVSLPYRVTEVILDYNNGFDIEDDVISSLIESKVLIQKGPWIYKDDINIGKGKKEAFKYLKENSLI